MCVEMNRLNKSEQSLLTPCFVIRTKKFDALLSEITDAARLAFKRCVLGYSFKTNNLPWIIRHVKNMGFWAEVVSSDEYRLARKMGFEPRNIIFNGPVKGRKEFVEAIENGSIVNIDSRRELEWLLECKRELLVNANVGVRVNFCLETMCPGESQCGMDDGRFGFSYENGELKRVLDYLKMYDIRLSGLHLHCSSKTRSLNIYKAIAKIAVQIVDEYGLQLDYVDVGGGFFGGVEGKPRFADYFSVIKGTFLRSEALKDVRVIIEPGMSVVGASIDYIMEVVDVKSTKNNLFVVTDGSRIHVDPLMRKCSYTYYVQSNTGYESRSIKQIICGFTCMENDRFFEVDSIPLQVGDKVVFEKVGAYTMGLSPQFIEGYPAVYAEQDGEYIVARNKQELPAE